MSEPVAFLQAYAHSLQHLLGGAEGRPRICTKQAVPQRLIHICCDQDPSTKQDHQQIRQFFLHQSRKCWLTRCQPNRLKQSRKIFVQNDSRRIKAVMVFCPRYPHGFPVQAKVTQIDTQASCNLRSAALL